MLALLTPAATRYIDPAFVGRFVPKIRNDFFEWKDRGVVASSSSKSVI